MQAALHVVRYLKGTTSLGLLYSASSPFILEAYCDSDWASCPITRRSLSGYCVFLGANPISWKTKNSPRFIGLLVKRSIEVWQILYVSYNGLLICLHIFRLRYQSPLLYGVTTNLLYI